MKKYLVVGLGKSGLAACRLLAGNDVSAWDAKPEEEFDTELVAELKGLGISCYFGELPQGEFDEAIVSPGIRPDHAACKLAKELKGELELAYENCHGKFVAITGTNGKTTVTTLVGEFVKAADIPHRVVGNIGNAVCGNLSGVDNTTLMLTEVSSYQLETVIKFHPRISAILNLCPDHLDRHGSAEEYYRCKCRIFENQNEGDFLVYNIDDEETVKHISPACAIKVPFTRTKTPIAFAMEQNIAYVNDGKIFVRRDGKDCDIINVSELQIPGNHNIENVLAAVMIGSLCGVKAKTMSKVLKNFKGIEHRMEFVRELKGVRYINDSKGTNVASSVRALEAINTPIVLIAGGYDKKLDFHAFINAFEDKVRYLILLGETASLIEKAALESGFKYGNIIKCSTLDACVASAAKLAEKGDTVLFSPACASWDMFTSFEERGSEFKRAVKEL